MLYISMCHGYLRHRTIMSLYNFLYLVSLISFYLFVKSLPSRSGTIRQAIYTLPSPNYFCPQYTQPCALCFPRFPFSLCLKAFKLSFTDSEYKIFFSIFRFAGCLISISERNFQHHSVEQYLYCLQFSYHPWGDSPTFNNH